MTENNFLQDIIKKADKNADGKTTVIELFSFLLKNPVFIFLAVVIISITPIKDFLLVGLATGVWDIEALLGTIISAIIALVFYLLAKATDGEYRQIVDALKAIFDGKIAETVSKLLTTEEALKKAQDENVGLRIKVGLLEYDKDHIISDDLKKLSNT